MRSELREPPLSEPSTSVMLVASAVSAAIDAIETSDRMSAYSGIPWPESFDVKCSALNKV